MFIVSLILRFAYKLIALRLSKVGWKEKLFLEQQRSQCLSITCLLWPLFTSIMHIKQTSPHSLFYSPAVKGSKGGQLSNSPWETSKLTHSPGTDYGVQANAGLCRCGMRYVGTCLCLVWAPFRDTRYWLLLTFDALSGLSKRARKPRAAQTARRKNSVRINSKSVVSDRKIRAFSCEQPTLASGKCLELQLSSTEVGFLFWRWNKNDISAIIDTRRNK